MGEDGTSNNDGQLHAELEICNSRGLHARASAKFVKCAEQFDADITVSRDGQTVPGTSIMGLMMLGAHPGSQIAVAASGPQAAEAIEALRLLVADKFGEDQD
jgi:phosphocarrier protein